jgi:hypothetical protein
MIPLLVDFHQVKAAAIGNLSLISKNRPLQGRFA